MFRVTPGTDFPAGRASPSPRASTWGGGAAVVAVTLLGLLVTEPAARRAAPGETEVAQRAAAVVAGVYRGEVDIDRRDRTLLLSYADEPVMSADRIAWAVCDSIRSEEVMARSVQVLRDWQVVALPAGGLPGSCRIGAIR